MVSHRFIVANARLLFFKTKKKDKLDFAYPAGNNKPI